MIYIPSILVPKYFMKAIPSTDDVEVNVSFDESVPYISRFSFAQNGADTVTCRDSLINSVPEGLQDRLASGGSTSVHVVVYLAY